MLLIINYKLDKSSQEHNSVNETLNLIIPRNQKNTELFGPIYYLF